MKKKIIWIALFILVLLFSFYLRRHTFWLPHWKGDQSHHVILAAKLDKLGFKHFNLRAIQIMHIKLDKQGQIKLIYPKILKNFEKKGDTIKILKLVGIGYYDQKFFHKPPGFPYMLLLSHRLFAKPNQPYTVVLSDFGEAVKKMKPSFFFEAQFWAVIVPLFFSLGLILLTFILGKFLFSYRVGLYASLMVAIHPVTIMTSQKLWTDDMLAFFVVLSLLLFFYAVKKGLDWIIILAGICCGIGVLAKQTAGTLLIAVWAYTVFLRIKEIKNIKKFFLVLFNKHFIFFAIGAFIVSGFWFLKIYQIYGDPFWLPFDPQVEKSDISGWFRTLAQRPPGWILYAIGIPYLCPLFLFSYISLKDFFMQIFYFFKNKAYDYRFILLWIIIFSFLSVLGLKREHRRMTAIYPLLAILSAFYLERFIKYRGKYTHFFGKKIIREIIIILLIGSCAFWSIPIGMDVVFGDKILIQKPF